MEDEPPSPGSLLQELKQTENKYKKGRRQIRIINNTMLSKIQK
jgi:hypothetical protein